MRLRQRASRVTTVFNRSVVGAISRPAVGRQGARVLLARQKAVGTAAIGRHYRWLRVCSTYVYRGRSSLAIVGKFVVLVRLATRRYSSKSGDVKVNNRVAAVGTRQGGERTGV